MIIMIMIPWDHYFYFYNWPNGIKIYFLFYAKENTQFYWMSNCVALYIFFSSSVPTKLTISRKRQCLLLRNEWSGFWLEILFCRNQKSTIRSKMSTKFSTNLFDNIFFVFTFAVRHVEKEKRPEKWKIECNCQQFECNDPFQWLTQFNLITFIHSC